MKRILLLAVVLAVMVLGCAQSPPAGTTEREITVDGKFAYRTINVSQLKSMLEQKDFLLVNVHIPYAGEIKGTDLFIPYNEIEANISKLPADKSESIVVYCRSGHMSAEAAQTLARLGYTAIRDVEGGMEAWERAGNRLVQEAR